MAKATQTKKTTKITFKNPFAKSNAKKKTGFGYTQCPTCGKPK